MVSTKRRHDPERLLILITALGLLIFTVVDGIIRNELDRLYVIGTMALIVGYFAKQLTDQRNDDDQ